MNEQEMWEVDWITKNNEKNISEVGIENCVRMISMGTGLPHYIKKSDYEKALESSRKADEEYQALLKKYDNSTVDPDDDFWKWCKEAQND